MQEGDNTTRPRSATQRATETEARPWWHEGVSVFSQVTGWIVAPLVAALYGGQYLDERQASGNMYFLGLTGIAFIISCIGVARIGTRYIQRLSEEDKGNKAKHNNKRTQ